VIVVVAMIVSVDMAVIVAMVMVMLVAMDVPVVVVMVMLVTMVVPVIVVVLVRVIVLMLVQVRLRPTGFLPQAYRTDRRQDQQGDAAREDPVEELGRENIRQA
jgi:hypothetical protein